MVWCRGYIIWLNTVCMWYGIVGGMVREKTLYVVWYVHGMVRWYGVVDILYG